MKLKLNANAVRLMTLAAMSMEHAHAKSMEVNSWPSKETESSKFQVVLPRSLKKEGGYVHKDALFGYPAYMAGTLQIQLISTNASGCEAIPKIDNGLTPFSLLIERGGCHFVTKVRNAQHAGARAVVIADNVCLCSDVDCMDTTGDTVCERTLPYMADDDMSDDVSIPSMLIRKNDADAIKEQLRARESNVIVQFEWNVPSPDNHVEWTLWMSSWDSETIETLDQLQEIILALGNRATFTPHFVSYNGSNVGCHEEGESPRSIANNICGNMCLNRGLYCLLDPTPLHNQESGASGADVVTENLRQKCVWKLTSKEDNGLGKKWWNYVRETGRDCAQDEVKFSDPSCFQKVMKRNGIDVDAVEKCMQPYGIRTNKPNPMLEEELVEQTALELLRIPALYVDGVHARGAIDPLNILRMICAGYGSNDPPSVCACASETLSTLSTCVKSGGSISTAAMQKSNGVSFVSLTIILITIFGAIGIAGFAYWRRTQSHMREQVRSILAEYMPMEEQGLLDDDELDGSPRLHPAQVASAKSPRGFMPSRAFMEEDDGM